MIELNLANYFQYNSFFVLTFFFISLGALLLGKITNGLTTNLLFSSYRSSLISPMTYIRFFTHIFGHADWKHFSNNFIYILLVGPMLEEKFGTTNIIIMVAITAAIIGIGNFVAGNCKIYGASGIVFMFIMLSSFTNIEAGRIPITLILIFLFYIVNEIIDAIGKDDNVSHIGHITGAICGIAFGIAFMNGIIQ